ncbi:sprT-like domain-containing protein Spartan isoform X2 [Falco rusticolus]|uniref:sprT-like domain-containing protein Spartan isoform X2 n=1 Tax=Falco rusticolus TaxID=120794 RepID=UPI0018865443|nr:sprT-like domain-containing protein Spartan isoform X2 [Falco rusticolus]
MAAAEEEDFVLALQLQALWEAEDKEEAAASACPEASPDPSLLRPLSVVDEAWELLDPSPDVHGLFLQFNETLFWGRLAAVEVSWSPRMTLCAGVCRYEGKGGMCSIRLSEPLLKLRPRKDLVEYAWCGVSNKLTPVGHSTIYHTFHDEVDLYRQHWWRCNGPCQNRKPYFGYVKRSTNRAPSARDFWWVKHQETCGGTFTKVKEPENFSKKSKEQTGAAKLPKSKSTNKGKTPIRDTQDLMPFSGKGYRLGGDGELSEKSIDFSSNVSSQHRSAVRTIPIPKNEIKFEKSPRNGIFFPLYTDDACEKINLASKHEFPKPSVANAKAYKNVSGSPVKIAHVVEEKSNQRSANGKRVMPFSNRPSKQICLEQTATAQVVPEKKRSECTNALQQWPKMEDKTAFENYFIKKGSTDVTLSVNAPVKTKAASTVSSASSSTAVRQNEKVSCPVCQTEVFESEINEHLDSCLA